MAALRPRLLRPYAGHPLWLSETPLVRDSEGSEGLLGELAKYGIDADAGGYLYKRQVQLAQIVEQEISPLLESVGLPRAAVEHGGLITSAGWGFTIPPGDDPPLVVHWYPAVEEAERLINATKGNEQEWAHTGRVVAGMRAMETALAEVLRIHDYQVDQTPSPDGNGQRFEVRIRDHGGSLDDGRG